MQEEAKRFEKESDHPDYYMQWNKQTQLNYVSISLFVSKGYVNTSNFTVRFARWSFKQASQPVGFKIDQIV